MVVADAVDVTTVPNVSTMKMDRVKTVEEEVEVEVAAVVAVVIVEVAVAMVAVVVAIATTSKIVKSKEHLSTLRRWATRTHKRTSLVSSSQLSVPRVEPRPTRPTGSLPLTLIE